MTILYCVTIQNKRVDFLKTLYFYLIETIKTKTFGSHIIMRPEALNQVSRYANASMGWGDILYFIKFILFLCVDVEV